MPLQGMTSFERGKLRIFIEVIFKPSLLLPMILHKHTIFVQKKIAKRWKRLRSSWENRVLYTLVWYLLFFLNININVNNKINANINSNSNVMINWGKIMRGRSQDIKLLKIIRIKWPKNLVSRGKEEQTRPRKPCKSLIWILIFVFPVLIC